MDATTRAIIGLVRAHAMHCAEQAQRHEGDEYGPIFAAVAQKAEELLEDVTYQAKLQPSLSMATVADRVLINVGNAFR